MVNFEVVMQMLASISVFASYVIPFLFVLALVVFVHELGHFQVGRWCGVHVEAFSIGFGPRVFGVTDRRGTEWKLSAIPLGGYVRFRGDLNAASMPDADAVQAMSAGDRAHSFPAQPVWRRAAIVAAGPAANFLFAIAIFAGTFMISGRMIVEPVIASVAAGSAAEAAGLREGDRIASIDGEVIDSFDSLSRAVSTSDGRALNIEIVRAGTILSVAAQPKVIERKTAFGMQRLPVLGVTASADPQNQRVETMGPVEATRRAGYEVYFVVERSLSYLGGLVAGREKADQLSGPVRIAHVSGKVAEHGLGALITLAAILSISIGFVNLMPVPMLDGGHLMFYLYEAVFGRPLGTRAQEIGFRIGFALVIAAMLFVTWNDIGQLARL